MGDSISEFNPTFQAAVNGLLAACSGLSITSGFRSRQEQEYLYQKYLAGAGNLAAPPGRSNHENAATGAVDLGGDLECAHRLAPQFGLHFPVPGEPWHAELADPSAVVTEPEAPVPEEQEDSLAGLRAIVFGQGPENPVDIPARVRQAFAPDEEPAAPASETEVEPVDAGGGALSDVEAAQIMAQAGFTGEALVTALAVAIGESGLVASVPGPTIAPDGTLGRPQGLFQIREDSRQAGTGGWRDGSQLYDPLFNARAAFAISNGGTNWQPWEVFTAGLYQQHLGRARAAVAQLGPGAAAAGGGPPAASVEPSEGDLEGLAPAVMMDPAGAAQEIAEMVLAQRQAAAGERVSEVAEMGDEDDDEPDEVLSGLGEAT